MLDSSSLAMSRVGRGGCYRALCPRVRRARWMLGDTMPLQDPWLVSLLPVVLCVLGDVVGEGVRSLRPHSEDSRDIVVI
jgi:hypothetical protein